MKSTAPLLFGLSFVSSGQRQLQYLQVQQHLSSFLQQIFAVYLSHFHGQFHMQFTAQTWTAVHIIFHVLNHCIPLEHIVHISSALAETGSYQAPSLPAAQPLQSEFTVQTALSYMPISTGIISAQADKHANFSNNHPLLYRAEVQRSSPLAPLVQGTPASWRVDRQPVSAVSCLPFMSSQTLAAVFLSIPFITAHGLLAYTLLSHL